MKINPLKSYGGTAITRQYKRAKHLTYLGAVASGTTLGFSSLFYHVGRNGEAFGLGGLGLVFLNIQLYLNSQSHMTFHLRFSLHLLKNILSIFLYITV